MTTPTHHPREFAGQLPIAWAFLLGNGFIGASVLLVPGMLDLLAKDFAVSIPKAGLLIGLAAVVMCVGAPGFAYLTSRWDRRKLLAGSLAWCGIAHVLCAAAPNFETLIALRLLSVVPAAIFTPQAGATLGQILPPEKRGSAITFIFLGWSIASVVAMPLAAWVGATVGWRWAFAGFGLSCAFGAWAVAVATPRGIQGVALPWSAWKAVAKHPALIALLLVTGASATGQFTTWAYIAPFTKSVLQPTAAQFGLLLSVFGCLGVVGNVIASRNAGRIGQPLGGAHTTVALACTSMAVGMVLLVLAVGHPVVFCIGMALWAIGVFASNSSQQARLQAASPELAGASIALNTSMIYFGQALGSFIGGNVIAQVGYSALPISGAVFITLAVVLSVRAERRVSA